jgi:hypothetical protein
VLQTPAGPSDTQQQQQPRHTHIHTTPTHQRLHHHHNTPLAVMPLSALAPIFHPDAAGSASAALSLPSGQAAPGTSSSSGAPAPPTRLRSGRLRGSRIVPAVGAPVPPRLTIVRRSSSVWAGGVATLSVSGGRRNPSQRRDGRSRQRHWRIVRFGATLLAEHVPRDWALRFGRVSLPLTVHLKTKNTTGTEPSAEPDPESTPGPDPALEPEPESQPASEPKPEPEPEPQPQPQPEPQPASEPASEPSSESSSSPENEAPTCVLCLEPACDPLTTACGHTL